MKFTFVNYYYYYYYYYYGRGEVVYRVLVVKPEGKGHCGDLGVDGWILLGWISRRWDVVI